MSNLIPIEFKNQRIMTTKVMAEQFGTEEKNIQMNFSNNEERFTIGKHFLKLEGQDLKDFKNSLPNDIGSPLKFASSLILWTDRGAARHAKILETDEAWEVYEKLEAGGILNGSKFRLVEYTDVKGEKRPYYELSKEGVLQLAARYNAVVRSKLIE